MELPLVSALRFLMAIHQSMSIDKGAHDKGAHDAPSTSPEAEYDCISVADFFVQEIKRVHAASQDAILLHLHRCPQANRHGDGVPQLEVD